MRKWKRRAAPSGAAECFPASAAFGRERWCCRSDRETGRERKNESGWDRHTPDDLMEGDLNKAAEQRSNHAGAANAVKKKKHMHSEKL